MVDPDEVVLVPSMAWLAAGAESGYHKIDTRTGLGMLERLDGHRMMEGRQFAHYLGRFDIHLMDDREVLDLIRNAIADGRAVVVQKGKTNLAVPSATVALRRLVAQVEKETRGKLSFRGRHYKLVVDVELAKMPGRDYCEIASQAEAQAVLDGAAKESPAQAGVLAKAWEKLTKDWHPPLQPEGLVLLRRISVQASKHEDAGPALTPSQIQQMRAPKEEVDPLMSGAGTELEMSEVELPIVAEEEPPSEASADAENSEVSPADTADSAQSPGDGESAKTAQVDTSGLGESNGSSEGNDGGADDADDGTAEDSKDDGGDGENEGGGPPEFW